MVSCSRCGTTYPLAPVRSGTSSSTSSSERSCAGAALARTELGELPLGADRAGDAAPVLAAARDTMRRDGARLWVARCGQLLAEVARIDGRWDEAFERLESARAVCDAADMDGDRDRC